MTKKQVHKCSHVAKQIKNSLMTGLSELNELITTGQHVLDNSTENFSYYNHKLLDIFSNVKKLTVELEGLVTVYELEEGLLPEIPSFNEIITAVENLSKLRHGALIAIERQDSLDEYIEACQASGAIINAEVSSKLLECIFYPGNPLHDGGIIIRKDTIVSSSCVFPLSSKKECISVSHLGTRHRAALGLSELTDALIIVVSEETGRICLAIGGALYCAEEFSSIRKHFVNTVLNTEGIVCDNPRCVL